MKTRSSIHIATYIVVIFMVFAFGFMAGDMVYNQGKNRITILIIITFLWLISFITPPSKSV